MNRINAYGSSKTIVISVRVSEEFNYRAIQHARHVLGYRDLSSFVRDAVEEKISGFDLSVATKLNQIERHLNRIAGVFIRSAATENVLPPKKQRKLLRLLDRTIEEARRAMRAMRAIRSHVK